jgi:hypothetical protein
MTVTWAGTPAAAAGSNCLCQRPTMGSAAPTGLMIAVCPAANAIDPMVTGTAKTDDNPATGDRPRGLRRRATTAPRLTESPDVPPAVLVRTAQHGLRQRPRGHRHERTLAPDDPGYGSSQQGRRGGPHRRRASYRSSRRTASSGKRRCSADSGSNRRVATLPTSVAQSYHALRHVNQADGERGCAPIIEWGSFGGVSLLWMQADDVPPEISEIPFSRWACFVVKPFLA